MGQRSPMRIEPTKVCQRDLQLDDLNRATEAIGQLWIPIEVGNDFAVWSSDTIIMWFSFWRSRDRFTLDELRYFTDQLQKVQIVNESNKDFVIEALRSIAELITYGDQHDSKFFEFFMDKQVMGEFARILKISKPGTVSLQLLQTISIMIQNLKSENAIYYMFSNEHINFLISYKFDFRNEELLSYYISFLRAISGKLDRNTISMLVRTENDEIVSFPLYVEAMRFAFHEENMIRTAVRALTLNIYHVGDESVNRFVAKAPHDVYFSNLVTFFRKQCINLNTLISEGQRNFNAGATSTILAVVDEIEDNLYYFSDVISAGIPDVGRLITENLLHSLILPLLLPSLQLDTANEIQFGSITSLYILCCILRIVKIKDLANTIAAALFFPAEVFILKPEAKHNGHLCDYIHVGDDRQSENNIASKDGNFPEVTSPNSASSSEVLPNDSMVPSTCSISQKTLRDALLSYIAKGDDLQVFGSLSVLATLLQTKELNEMMLDALGILPQRKQQKKLLLQALVGEGSGEDQLFSSDYVRDSFSSEIDGYLQKMKEQYGVCYFPGVGTSSHVNRFQVLDALVSLFCRPDISAETLWDGGWLLRQLLPYSEAEFHNHHLTLLQDSYKKCVADVLEETKGIWSDLFLTVLCDEWKKCKRAIEASSPPKEPKCMLLPLQNSSFDDSLSSESSVLAGERMYELVKVFVLLHQLQIFSRGCSLPEQPPIYPLTDVPENSRARTAGLDTSGPKPGMELKLVDAVPCRIAFERGKEHHFCFLALSTGTSGWILLLEELPLKQHHGVVRIVAPLSGSNPKIDEKHSKWLHLRIRPSSLPFNDPRKATPYRKTKSLVDGRWTLAFRTEESCMHALSMILEETKMQTDEVLRRLKPVLDFQVSVDSNTSK